MKTLLLLALGLLLPVAARADDDDDVETVMGRQLPALEVDDPTRGVLTREERAAFDERDFSTVVYRGASVLDLEPAYVHGIREGLELLYLREYKGARDHFAQLDKQFPGTGISAAANTLVWQALMLENFDFEFDTQYWAASKVARAELEAALDQPGQEAWEHFLLGGMIGIEAIHTMRHERYLPALQLAFDAMDQIARSKEHAPDFTDLLLADGMYNYWRSVVTISTDLLPDFGDNRVTGIQQMTLVEQQGIFLGPPATLSLAFTWLEERELKRAVTSCVKNKRRYPDNVINNLMLGNVYTYMRKFDSAIRSYDDILRVAPDNRRVHYYRGVALMRSGQRDEARASFQKYLSFPYMEDYQRAGAHYRLGQVYYKDKDYSAARAEYKAAVKINGHRAADKRLDRMKAQKKAGKIDY